MQIGSHIIRQNYVQVIITEKEKIQGGENVKVKTRIRNFTQWTDYEEVIN